MISHRLSLSTADWIPGLLGLMVAVWLGREAVTSPRLAVGAVVGLVLVAVIFWRLLAGVVLFTVLTFPTSLPSSIGVATLAKPVGLLIIVSWLMSLVSHRERFGREERVALLLRDQPLLSGVVVVYVAWALLSAVWAIDQTAAISNATRLVQIVILLFIVYSAVRKREDLRVMAWAYLVGASATSAYALASGVVYTGRITGGIVNPNFLAAELVVALVVGGFMLTVSHSALARLGLVAVLSVCGVAFIRTESREGLIALGVAFLAAIVLAGPRRPHILAILAVVLAIGFTYYTVLAPESVRARVTNLSAQGSSGRADTWRTAVRIGSDHPILGVGLGSYPVVSARYAASNLNLLSARYALRNLVAHNTYLEAFSELGIVGLALLVAVLGSTLVSAGRGIRTLTRVGDVETAMIARGLTVGTIGLLVSYVFSSGEYEKQLWILLGLLASLPAVAASFVEVPRQEETDERPPVAAVATTA